MDTAELDRWFGSLRSVRGTCDAAEVVAVRRRRELASRRAGVAPDATIAADTSRTGRDARAALEREALCSSIPSFHEALADGSVSAGHVDAAAVAVRTLEPDVAERFADLAPQLLHSAAHSSVDAFGRECRDVARHLARSAHASADADELERQRAASTVKRWVDRSTGMHNTLLSLDPLRDSIVWKAITAELATQRARARSDANGAKPRWNELQVNAVVAAMSDSGDRPNRVGSAIPEIGILIDWNVLSSEAVVAGICETTDGVALPASTVRRLCCDAQVFPVVLGGDGEVLDQGRAVRTATRSQRRALAAMHRCCAFPGCVIGFDACRLHHVRWWWRDLGPSDIANLLPLCEQHHHLVHEGGWQLTMTPRRVATWTAPDGTVHHRGSTIDRTTPVSEPHRSLTDRRPQQVPMRC